MPIAGLTDRTTRYPRLGKIHLGIVKTKIANGQTVEYPSAVDYFVCPEPVQKVFGEKPKELRIMIPTSDRDRWASQYYRCYSKTRGLVCKGDGVTCNRLVDEAGELANRDSKTVVLQEMDCKGRECEDYGKQCREIMNLQFLLPEVPGLGVWQIDTSSINSIRNINAVADLLGKNISMIPLLLTIEPAEVQDAEKKKRTVHVLNLRTNLTLSKLLALPRLAAGESELPISDDEVPGLLLSENQEEEQTKRALAAAPAKKEQASKPARDPGAIKNINDLYRACQQDFRLQPRDVLSELNYTSKSEITDPAESYRRIAAVRKGA